MENVKLKGHQKAHLRGLGQRLDSSLSVGKSGATPAVLHELDRMLSLHELVKVRLLAEREDRDALMEAIAAGSRAEIVGSVGKTVLLFRRATGAAATKITLPA
jgi:RNA-binding protein